MLQRQTRLRREFLYQKSLEQKEKQIWERKQRVKDLLAKGKGGKSKLEGTGVGEREIKMDASKLENGDSPYSHVDSEYSEAGLEDPRVLITTCRDPSSKLTQFAKELRLIFPNSIRLNRGHTQLPDLITACHANKITDLMILHEHRGIPDALMLTHFPHGPTTMFTLSGVVLRHELGIEGKVAEVYPHLIFDGFGSKIGKRVKDVLRYCFPVPKEDSKRTIAFINEGDFISFRHHVHVKTSHKEVQLAEVGPRFEMRPYEIRQGTIDQASADVEWVLRPYQRSGRKKNQL